GAFFARPDLQLTAWKEGPAGAENYESAALFVRYFVDRFGQEELYPLLARSGVSGPSLDRFFQERGGSNGFAGAFRAWLAANSVGSSATADFPLYRLNFNGAPRTQ